MLETISSHRLEDCMRERVIVLALWCCVLGAGLGCWPGYGSAAGRETLGIVYPDSKNLGILYTRDASGVYQNGRRIQVASPASFTLFGKYSGYTKDDKAAYWLGRPVKGADVGSFAPLPLTAAFAGDPQSRRGFTDILTHLAWDKEHLYHDGIVIHQFQYPVEAIYPAKPGQPALSSLVFARDEAGIIAIKATAGVRYLANVIRLFTVGNAEFATARDFRVLGELGPEAVVSVNADALFYNTQAVPGVLPAGARLFSFGDDKGVVTENAVTLDGYPRLSALNRISGEKAVLGEKGFQSWEESEDKDGRTIIKAFDGRFDIIFGANVSLAERGKPDEHWIIAYVPYQAGNPGSLPTGPVVGR